MSMRRKIRAERRDKAARRWAMTGNENAPTRDRRGVGAKQEVNTHKPFKPFPQARQGQRDV
jgi:hypothetical protein